MSTLSQLIVRTADRLSMVAGTGVQTYAEDRIAEMIQHKFDVLFDEVFWPQFLSASFPPQPLLPPAAVRSPPPRACGTPQGC